MGRSNVPPLISLCRKKASFSWRSLTCGRPISRKSVYKYNQILSPAAPHSLLVVQLVLENQIKSVDLSCRFLSWLQGYTRPFWPSSSWFIDMPDIQVFISSFHFVPDDPNLRLHHEVIVALCLLRSPGGYQRYTEYMNISNKQPHLVSTSPLHFQAPRGSSASCATDVKISGKTACWSVAPGTPPPASRKPDTPTTLPEVGRYNMIGVYIYIYIYILF